MCHNQTLAFSPEGYIIRCPDCNRIQLTFGTVAAMLNEARLAALRKRAAKALINRKYCTIDPAQKSLALPLNKNTMLCLSLNELKAFTDLLDQAGAVLEVYALLRAVEG